MRRQLNILYRGLDLLKVGGRLVYSTCSLNPIEDEAVVAAALSKHQGAVSLVPPPPHLAGVLAADGLATWVVPNPETDEVYESFEATPMEVKQGKTKLLSSMSGLLLNNRDGFFEVSAHGRLQRAVGWVLRSL